jgi:hypothetical protein
VITSLLRWIAARAFLPAIALIIALTSAARSDPEECQEAINAYNAAIGDVSAGFHGYATCVSESRGHGDCSMEFSTLQSAQSDFETAVSSYGSDCQ